MRIIDCISDTHGQHEKLQLPGGDLLIHAGDCCSDQCEVEDVLQFLDWFSAQQYPYHVLVPGNHDPHFELIPEYLKEECEKRGIRLLIDSDTTLEEISIWGSPFIKGFPDWAFCCGSEQELKRHWDLIPKGTEILITHGPPYSVHDEFGFESDLAGCPNLLKHIQQSSIKLHIFGHAHEGAGFSYLNGCTFVNAAASSQLENTSIQGYTRVIKEDREYRVIID